MGSEILDYIRHLDWLEASGLIFGLLAVWFLIKENIWTWPSGITYIFISFVIFWEQRLYGDFILHIFFLVLNVYGWYYWIFGKARKEDHLPVTTMSPSSLFKTTLVSIICIFIFGYFLENMHHIFTDIDAASLPYWDSATSVLSVTGMWLTARKKIENWYFWLIVDILATGIYIYKGIYFYAALYFIYIGLAVAGLLAWRNSLILERKP